MCSGQAILKNLIATLRGWKSTVRTLTRFVAIRSWYGLAMYSCFKSNEKGPVLTSLQHYLFPIILFRPVAYMIIWGVLPMILAPCPRKREINKGQTSVSFPFLFLSLVLIFLYRAPGETTLKIPISGAKNQNKN